MLKPSKRLLRGRPAEGRVDAPARSSASSQAKCMGWDDTIQRVVISVQYCGAVLWDFKG